VIPYGHNEPATEFCYDGPFTLLKCALHNAWVKFPDNATEMELPWLNDSYVHLNGTNKTLHFKVCEGFFSFYSFFKFVVYFSLSSGKDQFQNFKAP
jgi:hypothetical protein